MISTPMMKTATCRQPLARCAAVIGIMLACSATPLHGQYPVQQDGRLFDANTQLGAGRYNTYTHRPLSPLLRGNLSATGNVGRGFSLRSFSPISSPTAFRGVLGSGALSTFRRDSVSVADAVSPFGQMIGRPFYDPAQTVPTTGFLQGEYGVGWDRQGIPSLPVPKPGTLGRPVGEPLDLRLPSGQDLRSRILGAAPQPSRPEASTIFGVNRFAEPLEGPLDDQGLPASWGWGTELERELLDPLTKVTKRADAVSALWTPLDSRLPDQQAGPEPLGTPLEMALGEDAMGLLLAGRPGVRGGIDQPQASDADRPLPGVAQPVAPGDQPPAEAAGPAAVGAARLVDPSLLTGNDVFMDMQLALTLQRNPAAEWFTDMQAAVRQGAAATPELQEFADAQAEEFVGQVMDQPIRTFVGRGASALNDELLKAEALLDIGQYYDAAARYEIAYVIDPLNPLPLIGKGHALLAAGEYLSAAVFLTRGLERFPELVRFSVDLEGLIGSGEIIDIRRADIMRRLADLEDPRLRFLLGYLEYHTGDRESGLKHLEKAAAEAEFGSIIRRYPAMLHGGALPAPKLPFSVPTPSEPAPGESGVVPTDEPAPAPKP